MQADIATNLSNFRTEFKVNLYINYFVFLSLDFIDYVRLYIDKTYRLSHNYHVYIMIYRGGFSFMFFDLWFIIYFPQEFGSVRERFDESEKQIRIQNVKSNMTVNV